jgi:hypothetical protein
VNQQLKFYLVLSPCCWAFAYVYALLLDWTSDPGLSKPFPLYTPYAVDLVILMSCILAVGFVINAAVARGRS